MIDNMIDNKVFHKVNECLEKYIGGEIFFDELDKLLKYDKELIDEFMTTVKYNSSIYGENVKLVASGEFGLCLNNFGYNIDILVQGGLRKGVQICNLENCVNSNNSYLFLDDSYFSGKTANIIKNEIERNNGRWLGSYVIYDGSKNEQNDVYSIYRYYDFHNGLEVDL